MFDIGWTELMIIGIVALIVIGPKDLPDMFRTLGRFTAKAKGMAREFSRAMESAADEAGVKDVAKDLKSVTSAKSMGLDAVKDAASKFEAWDPMKAAKAASPTDAEPIAQPDPSSPKGPATQALADAQTAKRAARSAEAAKPETLAKAAPKPATSATKTSAKKPAAKKPAAKTAAKPAAKAPAKPAKTPAKPKAKKSDA